MIIWPQEMHKQRHRVFIRRIINWFLMFFLSEGNVLARILSRNTTDINIHHHLSALIGLLMFFLSKGNVPTGILSRNTTYQPLQIIRSFLFGHLHNQLTDITGLTDELTTKLSHWTQKCSIFKNKKTLNF
uniref:Uncharacterized protein n=1 Tax=Cacopsylla melanoneura TaxID=428564 RepID=A0A8D8SLG3_9HEMI